MEITEKQLVYLLGRAGAAFQEYGVDKEDRKFTESIFKKYPQLYKSWQWKDYFYPDGRVNDALSDDKYPGFFD